MKRDYKQKTVSHNREMHSNDVSAANLYLKKTGTASLPDPGGDQTHTTQDWTSGHAGQRQDRPRA